VKVLQESGKSLLAVGIKSASGNFTRGDVVACNNEAGVEIARGLVNYEITEVQKLLGHSSDKIEELLGYAGEEEIIHRDNLMLSS
jgi:glutamate 5-kinase